MSQRLGVLLIIIGILSITLHAHAKGQRVKHLQQQVKELEE